MEVRGKRILVVGIAKSGIAAALFLRSKGARVIMTEQRKAVELRDEISQLLDEGIAIETGGHRERSFLEADIIVVSPGVPSDMPLLQRARAQQTPVLGEIELAFRFLQGSVTAITGANGKTTTTSLTGELMKACERETSVGGNIGTPLISLVESSTPLTISVLELSSFQLETVEQFHAQIAAVLNLSPDHLDRHGSMEAYAAAKRRIFLNQTPDDRAVLNLSDPWCRRYATEVRSQVRWFSRESALPADFQGACVENGHIVWRESGRTTPVLPLGDIPLRGSHNLENVLAGVAMACIAQDVSFGGAGAGVRGAKACERIRDAVRNFKAVEHRLEFVARVADVDYFNDSKATNVDATAKALEAFHGGVWIILGGKDKGSDYTTLAPLLRARARGVLLIGAATEKIAAQLSGCGVPLVRAGTLDQAVSTASAEAKSGDTVLLAPACASFDQFQNYNHRGRVFKELVIHLQQRQAATGGQEEAR